MPSNSWIAVVSALVSMSTLVLLPSVVCNYAAVVLRRGSLWCSMVMGMPILRRH